MRRRRAQRESERRGLIANETALFVSLAACLVVVLWWLMRGVEAVEL